MLFEREVNKVQRWLKKKKMLSRYAHPNDLRPLLTTIREANPLSYGVGVQVVLCERLIDHSNQRRGGAVRSQEASASQTFHAERLEVVVIHGVGEHPGAFLPCWKYEAF